MSDEMKISEIVRMVVVLCGIAGVCSAILTLANIQLTPRIDQQTDFYVRGPALEHLFAKPAKEILNNKIVFPSETGDIPIFFTRQGDKVASLAIETTEVSFGGDLTLIVGIDLINKVQMGIEVVKTNDTPGLGARIVEPGFRKQWQGKPLDQEMKVTADGGVIDSISGASTTSRAACKATNNVLAFVRDNRDKIMDMIAKK